MRCHFFCASIEILTVRTNLSACSISCHASLTGTLVGSILEANNGLTGLQSGLVKFAFVLRGHFLAYDWTVKTVPLGQTSQSVEVVDYHVEVFGLIEIVDLKQVLSDQSIRFTALKLRFVKWSAKEAQF